MLAKRYTIRVVEGLMDEIHGGGQDITEVFVPGLNLFINSQASFVAEPGDRVPPEFDEIEVDGEVAAKLVIALVARHEAEEELRKTLF